MFLVTLVVTKHVDTIEVRLVEPMLFIRAALLEYQPASRFCFAAGVFVSRVLTLAIELLPGHKLTPRAIENNIARHRKLDLFSINPTSRRRRCCRRKSHFVPELIRLDRLLRLISLLSRP